MVRWLQSWIQANRFKTVCLVILFPIILGIAIFLLCYRLNGSYTNSMWDIVYLSADERLQSAITLTGDLFALIWPILIIWLLISFFYERKLIFHFTWATPIDRKDYPELYNIVENLCISRWLPTPKIGLMDEPGMNAYALWWRAKDSWICFTKGLIENLEPNEIEAVAWHELTHIMNKDTLLMLVMVLYIWAITTIGQILIRTSSSSSSKKNWLPLVWLVFLILGYIFYPLIRLAVSRKREYLADAGSVLLTHDNQAMISALRKISKQPEVNIDNSQVAALFIANPLSKISEIFQTHPSIENRIKALESY